MILENGSLLKGTWREDSLRNGRFQNGNWLEDSWGVDKIVVIDKEVIVELYLRKW